MPFSPSEAALIASSVYLLLPPSTTRSPSPRISFSSAIVDRVGSPAGTITQTTVGPSPRPRSCSTMSARLLESVRSGLRS